MPSVGKSPSHGPGERCIPGSLAAQVSSSWVITGKEQVLIGPTFTQALEAGECSPGLERGEGLLAPGLLRGERRGRAYRQSFHLQAENVSFFAFLLCSCVDKNLRTVLNGDDQSSLSRSHLCGNTSFQHHWLFPIRRPHGCIYSVLDILPLLYQCFFPSLLPLLLQGETC